MWSTRASFTIVLLALLTTAAAQQNVQEAYIEQYKDIAIREMERFGIPASIKLAQGILESNSGRSDLALKANNHFGIKISGNWSGQLFPKLDDEYDEYGNPIPSYFRVYPSAEDSYADHSHFLQKPRYASLFAMSNPDYKKWAHGLQQAGYATNPAYAQKLISIIERHRLYQYDRFANQNNDLLVADNTTVPPGKKPELSAEASGEVSQEADDRFSAEADGPREKFNISPEEADISFPPLPKPSDQEQVSSGILVKNDVKYVVLGQANQTIGQVAEALRYSTNSLLEYNDHIYSEEQKLAAGTIIYLQPKRKSFRGKSLWHVVSEGESMLDISNVYALDLGKLLERNLLNPDQEPAPGERIKLRGSNVDQAPKLAAANPDIFGQLVKEQPQEKPSRPYSPGNPALNDPFGPATLKVDSNGQKINKDIPQDGASINTPVLKNTDLIPLDHLNLTGQAITLYKVEQGDTLWRISKKYQTSVDQIKNFNRLTSDTIRTGMELRVKGAGEKVIGLSKEF